jgi:hypothetical protein
VTISFIILPWVFCSENDEAIIQQRLQLTLRLYFLPFLEHKKETKNVRREGEGLLLTSLYFWWCFIMVSTIEPQITSLCAHGVAFCNGNKGRDVCLFRVMGQKTYIPEFTSFWFTGHIVRRIVRTIQDKRLRWAWNAAWMKKARNIWMHIFCGKNSWRGHL